MIVNITKKVLHNSGVNSEMNAKKDIILLKT